MNSLVFNFSKTASTKSRAILSMTRSTFLRNISSNSNLNYFKHILQPRQNVTQICASNPNIFLPVISFKANYSKKRKKPTKDEDTDSEDEEFFGEEETEEPNDLTKDYKVLTLKLYSTRLDSVLKNCLKLSNKKIEEAFYESQIRLNGKKVLKKSAELSIGDEVDLIVGIDPHNENFLKIHRVILKGLGFEKKELARIIIKLHLFKYLTVENYKDSWQQKVDDGN